MQCNESGLVVWDNMVWLHGEILERRRHMNDDCMGKIKNNAQQIPHIYPSKTMHTQQSV
jgi:hypothetical protein